MTDNKEREAFEFRKKPVVIEAFQWAPHAPASTAPEWYFDACGDQIATPEQDGSLTIRTLEGLMSAQPGDWIIRGVKGELYPCKPDIFAATYGSAALAASQEKAEPVGYVGWYCSHCQHGVDASDVTYHEQHTVCGRVITNDRPPVAAQASEPVAYRFRVNGGGWEMHETLPFSEYDDDPALEIQRLYAAPQPSAEAAIRTLKGLGYTYHGGQQWKPPLGDSRVTVDRLNRLEAVRDAALEEAAERLSQAHSWLTNVAAARLVLALKSAPPQPAEQPTKAVTDCSTDDCQCDACCIERGEWVPASDEGQPAELPSASYADCCDTPNYCSSVRRCTAKDDVEHAEQPSTSTDSVAQDSIVQWARSAGIKGSRKDGSFTESDCARLADFALAARRGASPAALTGLRGYQALRDAINNLRIYGLYEDDEGEETDALEQLADAIARAQGEQA